MPAAAAWPGAGGQPPSLKLAAHRDCANLSASDSDPAITMIIGW